jgi:hypothetical protein
VTSPAIERGGCWRVDDDLFTTLIFHLKFCSEVVVRVAFGRICIYRNENRTEPGRFMTWNPSFVNPSRWT